MADEDIICNIEGCEQLDDKKNTVSYLICHKSYHAICANVKTKTVVYMYTECSGIILQMSQIKLEVTNLKQILNNQTTDLMKKLVEKTAECRQKDTENARLLTKVGSLTVELKQAKWKSFTEGPQELIFSDSMLSNIDQQKLQNTKVVVMSGARVEEIKTKLQKPEYHAARLDRLVLIIGTNDLKDAKDKPDSIPDIVQKYSALIEDAKAISQYVTISSVYPRIDYVAELVEQFNTNLQVLCEDKDCEFIDHTPIFTLGDCSINDGYLSQGKGPHLTKAGLNKVAKNIRLKVKTGVTDVTKSYQPRNSTPQVSHISGQGQHLGKGPQHWGYKSDQRISANGATRSGSMKTPKVKWNPDVICNRDGCVLCNEGGHSSSECHHRYRGTVICNLCQAPGHKAKHHI